MVTHKRNLVDNSDQTIYIIVQYLAEVISVVGTLGMARYDEDDPIGAKSVARPDTSGRDALLSRIDEMPIFVVFTFST